MDTEESLSRLHHESSNPDAFLEAQNSPPLETAPPRAQEETPVFGSSGQPPPDRQEIYRCSTASHQASLDSHRPAGYSEGDTVPGAPPDKQHSRQCPLGSLQKNNNTRSTSQ